MKRYELSIKNLDECIVDMYYLKQQLQNYLKEGAVEKRLLLVGNGRKITFHVALGEIVFAEAVIIDQKRQRIVVNYYEEWDGKVYADIFHMLSIFIMELKPDKFGFLTYKPYQVDPLKGSSN